MDAPSTPPAEREFGDRLAACAPRIRLWVGTLAGAALRRRCELDDFVQETFLRAVRDRARAPEPCAGDAPFARWLAEVARHVVLDAARATRRAKRDARVARLSREDWSSVGLAESAVLARTAGPVTRAVAVEETERLERALAALAPEHRKVIALRQLAGLSAAETARRMGRSEAAVHSLYRRALLAWEAGLTDRG
ncbi:MAG: RNA polymerase sigma factor [Planctomycetes bacterium]|nr:RNA polymerase sigma factor [Planctomycetota bacterium]